jgi:hypothetical protein
MKYIFFAYLILASGFEARAFAEDILVLRCELPHPVQTVTGFDIFGESATWPKLASGQGVSALGSARQRLTDGRVNVAQGVFYSDSAGINFTMMMVAKTYAIFDFALDTQNQHIQVTNRWNGVVEDFEMNCSTP